MGAGPASIEATRNAVAGTLEASVSGRTPAEGPPTGEGAEPDDDFDEEFFDASFLADLEGLAQLEKGVPTPLSLSSGLTEKLAAFLAPDEPGGGELTEDAFVELSGH